MSEAPASAEIRGTEALSAQQPLTLDGPYEYQLHFVKIDGLKYKPYPTGEYANRPIYFHKDVDISAGDIKWSKVSTIRRGPIDPARGGKIFKLNETEYHWNKTGVFKQKATKVILEEVKDVFGNSWIKEVLVEKITPDREAGTARRQAVKNYTGIPSAKGRRNWTRNIESGIGGNFQELQAVYGEHRLPEGAPWSYTGWFGDGELTEDQKNGLEL